MFHASEPERSEITTDEWIRAHHAATEGKIGVILLNDPGSAAEELARAILGDKAKYFDFAYRSKAKG